MFLNNTNYGRDGFNDWVIQRITAIFIFFYVVIVYIYICFYVKNIKDLSYEKWLLLFFGKDLFKALTTIAIVCMLIHAWIGVWTVITDYIKWYFIRFVLQIFINLLFFIVFFIFISDLWMF